MYSQPGATLRAPQHRGWEKRDFLFILCAITGALGSASLYYLVAVKTTQQKPEKPLYDNWEGVYHGLIVAERLINYSLTRIPAFYEFFYPSLDNSNANNRDPEAPDEESKTSHCPSLAEEDRNPLAIGYLFLAFLYLGFSSLYFSFALYIVYIKFSHFENNDPDKYVDEHNFNDVAATLSGILGVVQAAISTVFRVLSGLKHLRGSMAPSATTSHCAYYLRELFMMSSLAITAIFRGYSTFHSTESIFEKNLSDSATFDISCSFGILCLITEFALSFPNYRAANNFTEAEKARYYGDWTFLVPWIITDAMEEKLNQAPGGRNKTFERCAQAVLTICLLLEVMLAMNTFSLFSKLANKENDAALNNFLTALSVLTSIIGLPGYYRWMQSRFILSAYSVKNRVTEYVYRTRQGCKNCLFPEKPLAIPRLQPRTKSRKGKQKELEVVLLENNSPTPNTSPA